MQLYPNFNIQGCQPQKCKKTIICQRQNYRFLSEQIILSVYLLCPDIIFLIFFPFQILVELNLVTENYNNGYVLNCEI